MHIQMEKISRLGGKNKAMFERCSDCEAPDSCCQLPEGWDAVAAAYEQRIRWLKWTVIFPCMLVLVISLFLLFSHKAKAAGLKDRSSLTCSLIYEMPRTCDSVKTFTNRYGQRLAFWIARRCGASEADIEEAKQCLSH
jgi:hypothetical protein